MSQLTPEWDQSGDNPTLDGDDNNTRATSDAMSQSREPDGLKTMHGWRFWGILMSLSIAGLCSAIEGTIITNALPTVTAALGGGNLYLWVANAYFLASIATLPLYAQMSNIFGRRWLLLTAVALFTLGGGICGGAATMKMLIAGRAIQGLGGGGINLLIATVVADIVPLRERGRYMAIVLMVSTIGAAVGPFLGGLIVTKTTWRWAFYINLPIGGTAFVFLFIFLRVQYSRNQSWRQSLKRIDYAGNAIFILTIVSILISLTWGGTVYSWSTYHILVPLVLGFFGLFFFLGVEWTSKLTPEPSIPRVLLSNRTSAAALIMTMIHSIVTYWVFYFLPIYFQAVKAATPLSSGVDTLPTFAGIIPFAIVGGILMSKTGRYKPIHILAWCPVIISFGLFSIMDHSTHPAAWVWFQLISASGTGALAGIMLPAVQAPLDESLVATATGLWSFVRGFGAIWGVTIPSAIFNNECTKYAFTVNDTTIAEQLGSGQGYELATKMFLDSIGDPTVRSEVVEVFTRAIRTVWYVAIAFSVLGFAMGFAEKEIPLRTEATSEFGMEKEKDPKNASKKQDVVENHGLVSLGPSAAASR